MRSVVRALKSFATVLISSHILSEIAQTVDRILVIHRGKIVAEGHQQQLSGKLVMALASRSSCAASCRLRGRARQERARRRLRLVADGELVTRT